MKKELSFIIQNLEFDIYEDYKGATFVYCEHDKLLEFSYDIFNLDRESHQEKLIDDIILKDNIIKELLSEENYKLYKDTVFNFIFEKYFAVQHYHFYIKKYKLNKNIDSSKIYKYLDDVLLKSNVEFETFGNIRFCPVDDEKEVKLYEIKRSQSCCGIFDTTVTIDGKDYYFGGDYGH
jgi:hypothetical protein